MLKSWASHLTGPPVNPWMLRTAGEVADGVHVFPRHASELGFVP
jgi:hypothetical protein